MNTHVLIVDSTTFKYHLEYLFFGTGARDCYIDFNNVGTTKLNHMAENNLVSMIADGMRVRAGDNIIFYLQQNVSEGIMEGQFFGIFTAVNSGVFLDNYDAKDPCKQYLFAFLEKSLTFRGLITPYEVYPIGVTEWEALDEIKNIQSPHQMLWSLIYRKLKGNRGNTMITPYEAERLIYLIRSKNSKPIDHANKLSYDETTQLITATNKSKEQYTGIKTGINVLPRLITKCNENKAYESHLQAYITQNIGRGKNSSLDSIINIFKNYKMSWIGNEVACGVGMQRIDVCIELESNEPNPKRIILPIELKARRCQDIDIRQVNRYVNWLEQYYVPNRACVIQPALLGQQQSHTSQAYYALVNSMKDFNKQNSHRVQPILYFETSIENNTIKFSRVVY